MKDDAKAWIARRSGSERHVDDARGDHEMDYARIVHSGAFRRLAGKTQILAIGDDDFHRTRLTHSLEVAQVAEGVLQQLRRRSSDPAGGLPVLEAGLLGTISLAHDLGHPPFGHGGELALNYCMRDAAGFEGNAQTLRILGRLETFSRGFGADLTRRAMLGILKYPAARSRLANPDVVPRLQDGTTVIATLDRQSCQPPKAYYDVEDDLVGWILSGFTASDRDEFTRTVDRAGKHAKTMHKSFDCSIMDLADDIAYGVHDLEDAVALGLVTEARFRERLEPSSCGALLKALSRRPLEGGAVDYDGLVGALFGGEFARKKAIGRLVHFMLTQIDVQVDERFEHDLLRHRAVLAPDARCLLDGFQSLIVCEVIESARVQHLEFKGQRMVVSVFEALLSDAARLLPPTVLAAYERSEDGIRVLCDHVASMTDATLLRTYERLFSPRMGSVFDRH